jgi:CubicO group peptidase (beta-lactamase class C family)
VSSPILRTTLLRLLAATTIAHPTGAQRATSPDLQSIDSLAATVTARSRTPGVALAVLRGDSILLAKGYGLANVELNVPVSPETIFQSGSLGKMFTAAGVMHLVEAGKLRIDDPIRRWLPGAPADWQPITVRHLLTHTSGIPDYTTEAFNYRLDYTEEDLLRFAFGVTREFPPGSRWNYSNTGYVLLGIIIGKASGTFYGDYLKEHIFTPAGMTTTRIISEEDIIPHRADGYRIVNGGWKNQEWVSPQLNTTADGALYFSLRDLIAWSKVVRARSLLNAESWKQMLSPVRLTSGKHYPYGFGWGVDTVAGQLVTSHGGAWQGFSTHLSRWNGDDLTVVALGNRAGAPVGAIANGIAERLNPALVSPPDKVITDPEPGSQAQLRALLAKIAAGKLGRDDFAYVRAGFFPSGADFYRNLFAPLGEPREFALLSRREVGDDVIRRYLVTYPSRKVLVTWAVAPDGKVARFAAEPR